MIRNLKECRGCAKSSLKIKALTNISRALFPLCQMLKAKISSCALLLLLMQNKWKLSFEASAQRTNKPYLSVPAKAHKVANDVNLLERAFMAAVFMISFQLQAGSISVMAGGSISLS